MHHGACRWQVRLCLIRKDFMRAQILIRKVRIHTLQQEVFQLIMQHLRRLKRTAAALSQAPKAALQRWTPKPNTPCTLPQVSARAFAPRPDKKGQEAGEVGIEGTTIEQPEPVSQQCDLHAPGTAQ